MDKEYVRLLETVAEAAKLCGAHSLPPLVLQALCRLNAYRPPPPADTVPLRIAVYRSKQTKLWETGCLDDGETAEYEDDGCPLHAIITAHVPASPPAVPVIEGECEA